MDQTDVFTADFNYVTREEKSEYVWRKYRPILEASRILDVGADDCYLKQHLDSKATYWGVGLGGNPDQELDLDAGYLPFQDGAFETVLCFDVLEHLEHIHRAFDELCRVSGRHVIIALPNCAGFYWRVLTRFGKELPNAMTRFYGLPLEPPTDRHRWFFDAVEAEQFVRHRAALNDMDIVQIDFEDAVARPTKKKRLLLALARRVLLHKDSTRERLDRGRMWAVLRRRDGHV